MVTITDGKVVYESVKGLKSIFTKLTAPKIDSIYFDSLKFAFEGQETFILAGEIKEDLNQSTSEFFKWLDKKTVKTTVEDLAKLGKCLKKNAMAISYDDDFFKFEFISEEPVLDAEGKEVLDEDKKKKKVSVSREVIFYNKITESPFDKIKKIEETLSLTDIPVSADISSLPVFHLFLKEDKIIGKREDNSEKVIEIPSKRLLSLIDKNSVKVSISSRIDSLFRYVKVSSEADAIKMHQYFATI